jgi:hypothetical protein
MTSLPPWFQIDLKVYAHLIERAPCTSVTYHDLQQISVPLDFGHRPSRPILDFLIIENRFMTSQSPVASLHHDTIAQSPIPLSVNLRIDAGYTFPQPSRVIANMFSGDPQIKTRACFRM